MCDIKQVYEMTNNIISFRKTPKEEQTGCGDAFCLQCGHHWIAVAPTGTTALECPNCKTMKGLWQFEFYPPPGQLVRQCNCSNQLFYLTPEGHMCANCGIYQQY